MDQTNITLDTENHNYNSSTLMASQSNRTASEFRPEPDDSRQTFLNKMLDADLQPDLSRVPPLEDQEINQDEEYLITSRPKRKIRARNLFSESIDIWSQPSRLPTSKKKRKPCAALVQAHVYGKPCAVCLKILKTGGVLECCK